MYARANKTGHPLWAQGVVVGGDADRDVYHVRLDKNQKTLANVPRVDVCFNTEDPEAYARRRYAAYVARARATRAFRRELFVDCMPAESVPKVDERSAKRMVRLALNTDALRKRTRREDTAALLDELDVEYARHANKLAFEDALVKPCFVAAGRAPLAGPDARPEDAIEGPPAALLVESPEPFEPTPVRAAPARGTVGPVSDEYDFDAKYAEFAFRTNLSRPEVVKCTARLQTENSRLLRSAMFATHFPKPQRLDEFELAQRQAAASLADKVREGWVASIHGSIAKSFKDAGKGWYNLRETNKTSYDFSKMKRFLQMVRLRMEDTMRTLAETNAKSFSAMMCDALSPELRVRATNDVALASGEKPRAVSSRSNSSSGPTRRGFRGLRTPPIWISSSRRCSTSSRPVFRRCTASNPSNPPSCPR